MVFCSGSLNWASAIIIILLEELKSSTLFPVWIFYSKQTDNKVTVPPTLLPMPVLEPKCSPHDPLCAWASTIPSATDPWPLWSLSPVRSHHQCLPVHLRCAPFTSPDFCEWKCLSPHFEWKLLQDRGRSVLPGVPCGSRSSGFPVSRPEWAATHCSPTMAPNHPESALLLSPPPICSTCLLSSNKLNSVSLCFEKRRKPRGQSKKNFPQFPTLWIFPGRLPSLSKLPPILEEKRPCLLLSKANYLLEGRILSGILLVLIPVSPAITFPTYYTHGSQHKPLLPNTVPLCPFFLREGD